MRVVTGEEARRWCSEWPIELEVDLHARPDFPVLWPRFKVDFGRLDRVGLLPLARELTLLGCETPERFDGGLLWPSGFHRGVRETEWVAWRLMGKRPVNPTLSHG